MKNRYSSTLAAFIKKNMWIIVIGGIGYIFSTYNKVSTYNKERVVVAPAGEQVTEVKGNLPPAANNEIFVVKFSAPWCGPCKKMEPIFRKVASIFHGKGYRFFSVNIDENDAVATTYRIRGIPTIIIIRNGQVQEKVVGLVNFEELRETIQKYNTVS